MFQELLRAPSSQATQAVFLLEKSAVNVSFSGLPRTGPLSAPSAFANNDPAIFLTFRAGFGLETWRRTRTQPPDACGGSKSRTKYLGNA